MNPTVCIKAGIGTLITLGTALTTLFTGPDVQTFGDITQVQYAVAAIGALLAGLSVLQAALTDSPANVEQSNDIVRAAANLNQRGYARPLLLTYVVVALVLVLSIVGCVSRPPIETTQDYIGASHVELGSMANGVEAAQRANMISDQDAQRLKAQLTEANRALHAAAQLDLTGGDAQAQLANARALIAALIVALSEKGVTYDR